MERSSRNGFFVVPELQAQRVLLVDDESHRAHCAAALRSVGLDVIEAGGVREAHASAVREQPHLIVIHLKPETADWFERLGSDRERRPGCSARVSSFNRREPE